MLTPAAQCSDARIRDGQLIGDPTEGALPVLAAKGFVNQEAAAERSPRIAEIPFDSAHKFMATFHRDGAWVRMLVKGAPDVLLARAGSFLGAAGAAPLDDAARAVFEAENAGFAGQAMRVLAVAIHILWINIIIDGPPAMTPGLEPARTGIMSQPPRHSDERILSMARLERLLIYGLTMAAGTLGLFYYARERGESYALTLAFTAFVLFQFFNLFNARAEHYSIFNRQFFSNGKLWAASGTLVGLQGLVVHWAPAQAIFHTTALSAKD